MRAALPCDVSTWVDSPTCSPDDKHFAEENLHTILLSGKGKKSMVKSNIQRSTPPRPLSSATPIVPPLDIKTILGYEGRRQSILIVDDLDANRSLIQTILESFEFIIHQAANGHQALQAIEDHQPDLILLDLVMPEMDGYEVLRQLRQNPKYQQLKIVVLSGNVGEDDQERCLHEGADDFLGKPVNIHSLLTVLQDNLTLTWKIGKRPVVE